MDGDRDMVRPLRAKEESVSSGTKGSVRGNKQASLYPPWAFVFRVTFCDLQNRRHTKTTSLGYHFIIYLIHFLI